MDDKSIGSGPTTSNDSPTLNLTVSVPPIQSTPSLSVEEVRQAAEQAPSLSVEEVRQAAEQARVAAETARKLAEHTASKLDTMADMVHQRFERAETERTHFYQEQRDNMTEYTRQVNDGRYQDREQSKQIFKKMENIESTSTKILNQVVLTNGRVTVLETEMYGPSPDRDGGIKAGNASLIDSRKYITIGATILFAIYSFIWGPEHLRKWLKLPKEPIQLVVPEK